MEFGWGKLLTRGGLATLGESKHSTNAETEYVGAGGSTDASPPVPTPPFPRSPAWCHTRCRPAYTHLTATRPSGYDRSTGQTPAASHGNSPPSSKPSRTSVFVLCCGFIYPLGFRFGFHALSNRRGISAQQQQFSTASLTSGRSKGGNEMCCCGGDCRPIGWLLGLPFALLSVIVSFIGAIIWIVGLPISCICPCCLCVTVLLEVAVELVKAPLHVMTWFTSKIPC